MTIGSGRKITYHGRLLITGTSAAIPAAFTLLHKINFPGLIFTPFFDSLLSFDENTGVLTFLRKGFLEISATLNADAAAQPTEIIISTEFDDSGGWIKLLARTIEITVLTSQQVFMAGSREINKNDKMRFEISNPNNVANFQTVVLGNGAILPAGIIDFGLAVI